jgi:hypothetical protein
LSDSKINHGIVIPEFQIPEHSDLGVVSSISKLPPPEEMSFKMLSRTPLSGNSVAATDR